MTLVADIGNSRLKWAIAGAEGLQDAGAAEHQTAGLARTLEDAWGRLRAPPRVVVANVAGEVAAGVVTG